MKCLLDEKRKSIIKKNKEIKELSKQNAYLESIITDYDKLNTNNLDEKQKQKKALKILSEHIRHISKDLKKDEHEIYRVKNDQKMVMAEIEKLRDDISDILHAIDIPGNLYASSDSDSYNSE
jgi:chromosome segregation ATPase